MRGCAQESLRRNPLRPDSPAYVTHTPLGYDTSLFRPSLSGGPVRINAKQMLTAAHLSRGPWHVAYRVTFFYIFSAEPPYQILCATPNLLFNLTQRGRSHGMELEYATHLELHNTDDLYVSVGVDNWCGDPTSRARYLAPLPTRTGTLGRALPAHTDRPSSTL